mgnify:CR=1 FL=1
MDLPQCITRLQVKFALKQQLSPRWREAAGNGSQERLLAARSVVCRAAAPAVALICRIFRLELQAAVLLPGECCRQCTAMNLDTVHGHPQAAATVLAC